MSKLNAYKELIEIFDNVLSNRGCNDFEVDNTSEMYELIEYCYADNYRLSISDWKEDKNYYPPSISKDGTKIYTTDYTILSMIKRDLGIYEKK